MITLYNTATRAVEPLRPEGRLRFYCCGPTVYGPAHIGNFRTFLLQDVLRRLMELEGLEPLHVRNITDVDDKTIRGAQESQQSLSAFTQKWTQSFEADCQALGLLPPHVEPKATEHIPEMIALIAQLLERGKAYVGGDGSIYFRVKAFLSYGKLSRLNRSALQTQAENSDQAPNLADEYDRDCIADFALWKAYKAEDGAVFWESPWGRGRPGWHIECSAMSMKYLGTNMDLHAGGIDLCFPHHENEIAQSEGATGQPCAQKWFHSAHLQVDGQKMSKSLGNKYTLEDLQAKGYTPDAVRYALISGHYRQPLNFTFEALQAAQGALKRLEGHVHSYQQLAQTGPTGHEPSAPWGPFEAVHEALCEDLNTPKALGALFSTLNTLDAQASGVLAGLKTVFYALGLRFPKAESVVVPAEIQALAQARWEAKLKGDFASADSLRQQLLAAGWKVKDGPSGFTVLAVQG